MKNLKVSHMLKLNSLFNIKQAMVNITLFSYLIGFKRQTILILYQDAHFIIFGSRKNHIGFESFQSILLITCLEFTLFTIVKVHVTPSMMRLIEVIVFITLQLIKIKSYMTHDYYIILLLLLCH
jgi:hypothetical protein